MSDAKRGFTALFQAIADAMPFGIGTALRNADRCDWAYGFAAGMGVISFGLLISAVS